MSIEVTRVSRAFGAIVAGLDIAGRLAESEIERLSALLVEHKVLFFRQQPLSPQAQRDFAARFGTLHVHPIYPVLPELPEILLLDNHEAFLPDNDNWHTDVTFSQDAAARRHPRGEAHSLRRGRHALVGQHRRL